MEGGGGGGGGGDKTDLHLLDSYCDRLVWKQMDLLHSELIPWDTYVQLKLRKQISNLLLTVGCVVISDVKRWNLKASFHACDSRLVLN